MNSIIKSGKNNYVPIINSNTVIESSKSSSTSSYQSIYLKIDKTLSEFETDEQKRRARENLNVFSKEEISQLIDLLLQKDNDLDERLKKFEIWNTGENN